MKGALQALEPRDEKQLRLKFETSLLYFHWDVLPRLGVPNTFFVIPVMQHSVSGQTRKKLEAGSKNSMKSMNMSGNEINYEPHPASRQQPTAVREPSAKRWRRKSGTYQHDKESNSKTRFCEILQQPSQQKHHVGIKIIRQMMPTKIKKGKKQTRKQEKIYNTSTAPGCI